MEDEGLMVNQSGAKKKKKKSTEYNPPTVQDFGRHQGHGQRIRLGCTVRAVKFKMKNSIEVWQKPPSLYPKTRTYLIQNPINDFTSVSLHESWEKILVRMFNEPWLRLSKKTDFPFFKYQLFTKGSLWRYNVKLETFETQREVAVQLSHVIFSPTIRYWTLGI